MARVRTQTIEKETQHPAHVVVDGRRYHPALGALNQEAELRAAVLVVEDIYGAYEILGPVLAINDGIEVARRDYKRRIDVFDGGGEPPMWPGVYRVWCRDDTGDYVIAFEIREEDNVL